MMNVMVAVLIVCSPLYALQAETLWTPSLSLIGISDDNIDFTRTEPEDDFFYTIEPTLQIQYDQELTRLDSEASVYIRRYQDNDELDDEVYNFSLNGDTSLTERFRIRGGYDFTKDTTLDSELDEIGRIFLREDRISQNARLAPKFNLTERMSIGLSGRYRTVSYDSDSKVDYSVWNINVPLRWNLPTQIDAIYISPGYTNRDSNDNRSDTYNFKIGWDHESTQRLALNFSLGYRYTEIEYHDTGQIDRTENGLGALRLKYDFETGNLMVDFQHDLQNTADGGQVNVTKAGARLQWNFTERMGLELNGKYYYTQDEGDNQDEAENSDDTSQFFKVGTQLYYFLTENHRVFIAYDFAQDRQEENNINEPDAERNRFWAGISLNFPMI
jgi:hypothetical protein